MFISQCIRSYFIRSIEIYNEHHTHVRDTIFPSFVLRKTRLCPQFPSETFNRQSQTVGHAQGSSHRVLNPNEYLKRMVVSTIRLKSKQTAVLCVTNTCVTTRDTHSHPVPLVVLTNTQQDVANPDAYTRPPAGLSDPKVSVGCVQKRRDN